MDTFILKSGGATGSDRQWQIIGESYNCLEETKHYYIQGSKTPYGNTPIPLSTASKLEVDSNLLYLNKYYLNRKYPTTSEYTNDLLRRNYLMCLGNVNYLFAIGTIKDEKIQGGTAWGVHSMCFLDKHVYFFDQSIEQWYSAAHSNNKSILIKRLITPTIPSKLFVGIGTRKINKAGIKAIHDVYQKTLNL